MARDCPDRQRGSDWRNNNGGFGGRRAIGGGDAVDREMEVCFLQFLSSIQYTVHSTNISQQLLQELSGGAPGEDGHVPRRIEAGPDQSYDDRDVKPWQRGPPPSDVAPWQQRGRDRRDDYGSRDHGSAPPWAAQGRGGGGGGGGDYGYGSHGGYGAPGAAAASAAAPWQQAAPPPPPGGQASYGYGAYPAYPGMGAPGAPPGLSVPPPPPGMPSMYYGSGSPPPPPPGEGPPPPVCLLSIPLNLPVTDMMMQPPSDQPPPPPPPA